jgi:hypothetical protein
VPDEYGLEIELPSRGVSLAIARVADIDACAAIVNEANPPREFYLDGGVVALCPPACCLAQVTDVDDLIFHETFACQ